MVNHCVCAKLVMVQHDCPWVMVFTGGSWWTMV